MSGKIALCEGCRDKLDNIDFPQADISENVFRRLESEVFDKLDACIVGGNNHGEQVLSRWWPRFVNTIRHDNCLVEVVSNCTLLTEERIEEIVRNNIHVRCCIALCHGKLFL